MLFGRRNTKDLSKRALSWIFYFLSHSTFFAAADDSSSTEAPNQRDGNLLEKVNLYYEEENRLILTGIGEGNGPHEARNIIFKLVENHVLMDGTNLDEAVRKVHRIGEKQGAHAPRPIQVECRSRAERNRLFIVLKTFFDNLKSVFRVPIIAKSLELTISPTPIISDDAVTQASSVHELPISKTNAPNSEINASLLLKQSDILARDSDIQNRTELLDSLGNYSETLNSSNLQHSGNDTGIPTQETYRMETTQFPSAFTSDDTAFSTSTTASFASGSTAQPFTTTVSSDVATKQTVTNFETTLSPTNSIKARAQHYETPPNIQHNLVFAEKANFNPQKTSDESTYVHHKFGVTLHAPEFKESIPNIIHSSDFPSKENDIRRTEFSIKTKLKEKKSLASKISRITAKSPKPNSISDPNISEKAAEHRISLSHPVGEEQDKSSAGIQLKSNHSSSKNRIEKSEHGAEEKEKSCGNCKEGMGKLVGFLTKLLQEFIQDTCSHQSANILLIAQVQGETISVSSLDSQDGELQCTT